MAAMAGHVDHFMPGRDLLQGVEVVDLHAVVDLVPEPGQQERDRAHHRMRVVGGDLPGVTARAAGRLLDADALPCWPPSRPPRARPRLCSTASITVRRCERSGPITAVRRRRKCARITREALRTVRSGSSPSAVTSRRLIAGLKCTMVSRPLSRIASRRRKRPTITQFSENSTRNQPLLRLGARPTKIDTGTTWMSSSALSRSAASSSARPLEWSIALGFGEEPGLAVLERQHRARAAQPVAAHGLERRRQAGLAGGLLEDQRIGEPVALQQVAHRRLAGAQHRAGVGRIGADAQPRTQQPRHEPERPGGAGGVGGDYAGRSDGHDGVRRRVAARARARAVGFGRGAGLSRRQRPPPVRRTWPVPRSSACRTSARRPRPVRPRRTAASPAGCSGSSPWPDCPRAR